MPMKSCGLDLLNVKNAVIYLQKEIVWISRVNARFAGNSAFRSPCFILNELLRYIIRAYIICFKYENWILAMLSIKCAACKQKLCKYKKIGKGEVLRCHKDRMTKIYNLQFIKDSAVCSCGNRVGIDKGSYIKMIRKAITYSGTKTFS